MHETPQSSPDIPTILRSARTIAVVGCSNRPERTSHRIARYLQQAGYHMIPVNPNHTDILGETCYPTVDAIEDSIDVDIVDIFRRPVFVESVVQDVGRRKARLGQAPVIWTQIGVSSQEAREAADRLGLPYIANRCTMVEHARIFG